VIPHDTKHIRIPVHFLISFCKKVLIFWYKTEGVFAYFYGLNISIPFLPEEIWDDESISLCNWCNASWSLLPYYYR
jgi:hypothetical protein